MKRSTSAKIGNQPTGLKRSLFAVVMILLPVLFFVVVELALRALDYGHAYPLFVPVDGFSDYMRPSEDVAGRYFETVGVVPGIPFDSFKARKDSSAFRIFVQGGSTAAGFPFYFGGSFPDMLEQRLLQTFPGRSIEVINTAMAAVNSYTLADFVDEIIAQSPDLVLIYAGHNEYYGALGVASSESLGRSPHVVRLWLRLRKLRTVQGLRSLLARASGLFGTQSGAGSSGTLMERMVGEQRIVLGSDLYRAGLRQFEYNLDDILARYDAAGVPVLIGTVVSNERDHRPFLSGRSKHNDPAELDSLLETANRRLASADTAAALQLVDHATALDTLAALPYFVRAKLLDAQRAYPRARQDYKRAKDRDELRFRAPEPINAVIRSTARKYDTRVVETENAVAGDSESGIPGSNVMTEHLHPNIRGYFLLADAFYDAIHDEGLIGEWRTVVGQGQAERELLVTSIDSIAGAYRIQNLKNSWPFRPFDAPDVPLDTIAAGTVEGRLGLALYQRSLPRADALEELHRHYVASNNLTAALQSLYSIIQRYPFLSEPYLAASNVLVRARRYDDALEYALAASERGVNPDAHRMAGTLLVQKRRFDEAIPHLNKSLEADPANLQSLYNLAGAYALSGRADESREVANRILTTYPDHPDTKRLLDSLPD